jgi:hypothetical protein
VGAPATAARLVAIFADDRAVSGAPPRDDLLAAAEHRRISSGDGESENGGGVGRGNRGSWRLSRLLPIFIG